MKLLHGTIGSVGVQQSVMRQMPCARNMPGPLTGLRRCIEKMLTIEFLGGADIQQCRRTQARLELFDRIAHLIQGRTLVFAESRRTRINSRLQVGFQACERTVFHAPFGSAAVENDCVGMSEAGENPEQPGCPARHRRLAAIRTNDNAVGRNAGTRHQIAKACRLGLQAKVRRHQFAEGPEHASRNVSGIEGIPRHSGFQHTICGIIPGSQRICFNQCFCIHGSHFTMTQPELLLPERGYFSAAGRLRRLFTLIAQADSLPALRTAFVPAAAAHFAARRAALMLFEELPCSEMKPEIRDNPVVRYLFERHTAVHEAVVLAPEQWSALCPWSDHGHVLTGPIVRGGELIGALALTRARDEAAFDAADLADASALCSHLCAWFAHWSDAKPLAANSLTPREHQITELVAQGLTNAQVGARLYVSGETVKAALKSIFRKTNVHSRTELAALYLV